MIPKLKDMFGNNYEFSILEYNNNLPSLSRVRTKCMKHNIETDDIFLNILHKPKPCITCLMEDSTSEISVKQTRTKRTISQLIEDFKKVHQDRFMYHDIEFSFRTMKELVWIKCKKHNHWFQQTPANHLTTRICCPKCYEEFIKSNDTYTNYDPKIV